MFLIDLKTHDVLRTFKSFDTPHCILFFPDQRELYIADGSKEVKILNSNIFEVKKTIPTTPGTDSMGVDRQNHRLHAMSGGKDVKMTTPAISDIDASNAKLIREIPINAAHVEEMALEEIGPRLSVNMTDKNYLGVMDRSTGRMVLSGISARRSGTHSSHSTG